MSTVKTSLNDLFNEVYTEDCVKPKGFSIDYDVSRYRCSWCNKVAHEEIADEFLGDYTKSPMMVDPRDETRIICTECYSYTYDDILERIEEGE